MKIKRGRIQQSVRKNCLLVNCIMMSKAVPREIVEALSPVTSK